jgi:hypothetical protein
LKFKTTDNTEGLFIERWRQARQRPSENIVFGADAITPGPAESLHRLSLGVVFATHPAVVSQGIDHLEKIRIVDFAHVRLVTPRRARNLDVPDAPHVGTECRGQIPLLHLGMIEIVTEEQVFTAHPVHYLKGVGRAVQKIPGNIDGVFRFDEQPDFVFAQARLRAAGATIVGKTNTPEFGCGAITNNLMYCPTANPFNTELTSGGSSGGSAVAIATGMVPPAHGTDFGGSVRTPASFCGTVGLRPTPGRIPDTRQSQSFNRLSSHGVLARGVEDAALMLKVMTGPDPRDYRSTGIPELEVPDFSCGSSEGQVEIQERIGFSVNLGGVAPIPNAAGNVTHINGAPLANIIDYLIVTFAISLVGMPTISIPCAWSDEGLPIGLQLVAPPYKETRLLKIAATLDKSLGFCHR